MTSLNLHPIKRAYTTKKIYFINQESTKYVIPIGSYIPEELITYAESEMQIDNTINVYLPSQCMFEELYGWILYDEPLKEYKNSRIIKKTVEYFGISTNNWKNNHLQGFIAYLRTHNDGEYDVFTTISKFEYNWYNSSDIELYYNNLIDEIYTKQFNYKDYYHTTKIYCGLIRYYKNYLSILDK